MSCKTDGVLLIHRSPYLRIRWIPDIESDFPPINHKTVTVDGFWKPTTTTKVASKAKSRLSEVSRLMCMDVRDPHRCLRTPRWICASGVARSELQRQQRWTHLQPQRQDYRYNSRQDLTWFPDALCAHDYNVCVHVSRDTALATAPCEGEAAAPQPLKAQPGGRGSARHHYHHQNNNKSNDYTQHHDDVSMARGPRRTYRWIHDLAVVIMRTTGGANFFSGCVSVKWLNTREQFESLYVILFLYFNGDSPSAEMVRFLPLIFH